MKLNRNLKKLLIFAAIALVLFAVERFAASRGWMPYATSTPSQVPASVDGEIPEFSGEPYVILGDNRPDFTAADMTTEPYEMYGELDTAGRCGVTSACIGPETMPTEPRESISHIYPSGWNNVPYSFVDGEYLYNRCHLIGFQLTGENDNALNLITGTRYMNTEGMLPFENKVAAYIRETGNHVLYRVTPDFADDELVARGVRIEAFSVEDNGAEICFDVYCYNVQPGVLIDYTDGSSELDEVALNSGEQGTYVLNAGSKRFHLPECSGAAGMKEENRQEYTGSRELLIAQGYEPCGQCDP